MVCPAIGRRVGWSVNSDPPETNPATVRPRRLDRSADMMVCNTTTQGRTILFRAEPARNGTLNCGLPMVWPVLLALLASCTCAWSETAWISARLETRLAPGPHGAKVVLTDANGVTVSRSTEAALIRQQDECWVCARFDLDRGGEFHAAVLLQTGADTETSVDLGVKRILLSETYDVVMVLDASHSMRKNDPNDLRAEAVRRFIDLARNSRRIRSVAMVVFRNSAALVLPPTAPEAIGELAPYLKKLKPRSSTNFDEPFRLVAEQWQVREERKKAALFLSDGEPMVRYRDSHKLLAEHACPVYTIGLSKDADADLLSRIAEETGGGFFSAPTADDLSGYFTEIFRIIASTRTILEHSVYVRDTSRIPFVLDSTMRNPFLNWAGIGGMIRLSGLSGAGTQETPTGAKATWRALDDLDVGQYRAQFSGAGRLACELTADTPLRLEPIWLNRDAPAGLPLMLAAYVDGTLPTDSVTVRCIVESPDGKQQEIPASATPVTGLWSWNVGQTEQAGTYHVAIVAEGNHGRERFLRRREHQFLRRGTSAPSPLAEGPVSPESSTPLPAPVDRARDMKEQTPREFVTKPELEATFWIEEQVVDFSELYPGQTGTRTLGTLIGHAGSEAVTCRIEGDDASRVQLTVAGIPERNRKSSVAVRAVASDSSAGQRIRGDLVMELGSQRWRVPIRGRVNRPSIVAELAPMATAAEHGRPLVQSTLRVHLDPEGSCPLTVTCALDGLSLTPNAFRATPDMTECLLSFAPTDYPEALSWQSEIRITGPGLADVLVPVHVALPPPAAEETSQGTLATGTPGPKFMWGLPNWLPWLLLVLLLLLLAALLQSLRLSRRAVFLLISALVHGLVMLILIPRTQPQRPKESAPGTVHVRTGDTLHEERIAPEVPAPATDADGAPSATEVEKLAAAEASPTRDQSKEAAPAPSGESVTDAPELTAPPETQPSTADIRDLLAQAADPARKREDRQERPELAAKSSLEQLQTPPSEERAAESATLDVTPAVSVPRAVARLEGRPSAVTPVATAPKALVQAIKTPVQHKPTERMRKAEAATSTRSAARVAIRTYAESDDRAETVLSASTNTGRSAEATERDLAKPGHVARATPGSLREITTPTSAVAPTSSTPGDALSESAPAHWEGAPFAAAHGSEKGEIGADSAAASPRVPVASGEVGGKPSSENDLSTRLGKPGRMAGIPSELASVTDAVSRRRVHGSGNGDASSSSAAEFGAGPTGIGTGKPVREAGQALAATPASGGGMLGRGTAGDSLAGIPSPARPSAEPGDAAGSSVSVQEQGGFRKTGAKKGGVRGDATPDRPAGSGGFGPALSDGAGTGDRPRGQGLAVAGVFAAVTAGTPGVTNLPRVTRTPNAPGQLGGTDTSGVSTGRVRGKPGRSGGSVGNGDDSPLPLRQIRKSVPAASAMRAEKSIALAVGRPVDTAVMPGTDDSTSVLSGTVGPGRDSAGTQWSRTFPLVKYAGDWDCDKTAMLNLAHHFENRTGSLFPFDSRTVALTHPELDQAPFLFVTGHRDFSLNDRERTHLREYVEQGGALWINDSTDVADTVFDQAVRREVRKLFPDAAWRPIPMSHPVFQAPYNLSEGFLGYRVPPGDKYRTEYLEGIWIEGRLAVVYTRNDYGDGLEIDVKTAPLMRSLSDLTPAQMQEASVEMGMNIVSHFLSGGDTSKIPKLEQPGYLMHDRRAEEARKWAGASAEPLPILTPVTAWSVPAGWGSQVLDTNLEDLRGPPPALSITFSPNDQTFRAWYHQSVLGRQVDLEVGKGGAVLLDAVSHLAGGARISIAFALRGGHAFIEAQEVFIRPGMTANVAFDLSAATFKTAASKWRNTESLPADATAEQMYILIHPQQGEGRIDVSNVRLAREKE